MAHRLGFAILGPGVIATYHHEAIRRSADLGAQLVAIGHYDPARFDALGEEGRRNVALVTAIYAAAGIR